MYAQFSKTMRSSWYKTNVSHNFRVYTFVNIYFWEKLSRSPSSISPNYPVNRNRETIESSVE